MVDLTIGIDLTFGKRGGKWSVGIRVLPVMQLGPPYRDGSLFTLGWYDGNRVIDVLYWNIVKQIIVTRIVSR